MGQVIWIAAMIRTAVSNLRIPLRTRIGRALSLMLAVSLLLGAWPLAMASIVRLPADPVLRQLRKGQIVDPDALEHLIHSRRTALSWRNRPEDRTTLGLAYLIRAERASADANSADLDRAEVELRQALRVAPVDPHAWARLALVWLRQDRPHAAAEALRLSYVTGPHVPRLQVVRTALARQLEIATSSHASDRHLPVRRDPSPAETP